MEPNKFSELPVLFQVVAGAGLFLGTFMLAIGGWLWKVIKPKLPESMMPTGAPDQQAVVLGAAIADSQSIKALAGSIDRLVDFLREDAEDDGHQMKRNRDVLCEIRDSVDALAKHVKNRTIV